MIKRFVEWLVWVVFATLLLWFLYLAAHDSSYRITWPYITFPIHVKPNAVPVIGPTISDLKGLSAFDVWYWGISIVVSFIGGFALTPWLSKHIGDNS